MKAVLRLGDMTILGCSKLHGNTIRFEGIKILPKRPLKNPVKIALRRLYKTGATMGLPLEDGEVRLGNLLSGGTSYNVIEGLKILATFKLEAIK